MKLLLIAILMNYTYQIQAVSPDCSIEGGTPVSWPTVDPIWEMCYLRPSESSSQRGSSLEVRAVHLNGILAIERAHVPMLFAKYSTSLCYRDWKDTPSSFLRADRVENPTRAAITTCDVSSSETQWVGTCPFTDLNGGGSIGSASDCTSGVQVEKYEDKLVLTTNHSASWYKYSSRFTFYSDGRIAPRFGFGNSDGTNRTTTHWHHAYWRINFDIDGPEGDSVASNEVAMDEEFFGFRNEAANQTWSITDKSSGLGFRIEASAEDYLVGTNPSESGQHNVDIMATKYKVDSTLLPEYTDTPNAWDLFDCNMHQNNLVNGENLKDEDVVFWYRTAVQDLANTGLICKFGGPIFYPIGDWGLPPADLIYKQGFE